MVSLVCAKQNVDRTWNPYECRTRYACTKGETQPTGLIVHALLTIIPLKIELIPSSPVHAPYISTYPAIFQAPPTTSCTPPSQKSPHPAPFPSQLSSIPPYRPRPHPQAKSDADPTSQPLNHPPTNPIRSAHKQTSQTTCPVIHSFLPISISISVSFPQISSSTRPARRGLNSTQLPPSHQPAAPAR
jgi:hypothetical protein